MTGVAIMAVTAGNWNGRISSKMLRISCRG